MKGQIANIVEKHIENVLENYDYYKGQLEYHSVSGMISEELGDLLDELLDIDPDDTFYGDVYGLIDEFKTTDAYINSRPGYELSAFEDWVLEQQEMKFPDDEL